MKKILVLASIIVLGFTNGVLAKKTIKLATTTSTYETGILDYILSPFEKENDVKVHIISVGTGKAIKLAENGDVDIILVHARKAEDKFVHQGYGVNRRDVMYNDFIILGSADDPAKISGSKNAVQSLKKIYETGSLFVSRGDNSGTDKKEKYLWSEAGIKPEGNWYMQAGQGMSTTLRIADEKGAYVLVDRGTYLFHQKTIRLKLAVEGDKNLSNPYGVIAVNPHRHSHVKYQRAMSLIAWLTSPKCQNMINKYKVRGNYLYHAVFK